MSLIYRPKGRAGEYAEWACNLYDGCTHGCRYCYVPLCRHVDRAEFHAGCRPYPDVLARLEKDAGKLVGKIATPILLSFTSDAYQPGATITREAIRILKAHGFAVCILTKGGLRATRDLDLLTPADVVASSLTIAENKRADWEPGAAVAWERIELLRRAKERAIQTWASLEPVIDPAWTFAQMRLAAGKCDLFKIGTMNHMGRAAPTVAWRAFALEAVALCRELNTAYYLKNDLWEFVRDVVPQIGRADGTDARNGTDG